MTEDISPPPATIKKEETLSDFLYGSGGRTRTSDLRVMSPTSCQLLYPAMYRQMVDRPIFRNCECKDKAKFLYLQIFIKNFYFILSPSSANTLLFKALTH